jgi:hypothetical protein
MVLNPTIKRLLQMILLELSMGKDIADLMKDMG